MSEPQLFAGIVPICGIGYAWNSNVLDMPIWMFHGDKDTAISVYHSDEMATYLTKFEKNFKYTRYEGVGHNCWDLAYNEETLNWLLSLSR
jgi:predicted peptidase